MFGCAWRECFDRIKKIMSTHVDLMVMQRSCSSLRVSVKRVSPALAPAMIPAFDTNESVNVDFPWSTWAMTDMLRMFFFLSIMARISSTVKFTYKEKKKEMKLKKGAEMGSYEIIQASRSVYKSVSALQSKSLKSTCKILWNSKSHLFIDENEKKNGWFCIEILKFERYLIKFVIVAYSFHCIHIFLCCMFRTRFDHCVIDPSAIRCTSSNFSIQYLKLNFPNENYRFHRK